MHCRRQLGQLAEIQHELAAEGIGLVAISVDLAPESQLLARRLGIEFPLLSDPQAEVAEAWGVVMLGEEMAIPATFVVRKDGTIAWRHVGETVPDRPPVDVVREQARAASETP
jgi:peroxiredoxin